MHVLVGIEMDWNQKAARVFPIYGAELYCFPEKMQPEKRESLSLAGRASDQLLCQGLGDPNP